MHPAETVPIFSVLCLNGRAVNLLKWVCQIPGKKDTLWDTGFYPLNMEFSEAGPCTTVVHFSVLDFSTFHGMRWVVCFSDKIRLRLS